MEKPQKSRNSLLIERKRIRSESVGIENIFCRIRAERNPERGYHVLALLINKKPNKIEVE